MTNKTFIVTINSLRFYLFLFILATHYKYIIEDSQIGQVLFPYLNYLGIFAVLFFFVLSGFCISLGYSEKFDNIDKTSYLMFLKKRMIKIYPLYIITGFIMLLLFYLPHNFNWIYAFIFLYIPMLAPYTPFADGGGNGAGWFLSALFLCYLITPLFIKIFNKKSNIYLFFTIYVIISFISLLSFFVPQLQHSAISLYKFPPVRLFQYCLGLVLGIMYVKNVHNLQQIFLNIKNKYLTDVFILILFILVIFLFNHCSIVSPIIDILLISVMIIYFCNVKSGFLYKLLSNKLSQKLGNISFECYMIHYPLCVLLSNKVKPYCSSLSYICIFYLLFLILTIILSLLYKYFLGLIRTEKGS